MQDRKRSDSDAAQNDSDTHDSISKAVDSDRRTR